MLKRTPLFETHQALGARLVDFGGWEMPVQYTSILDEHHAVRNAAGIFDISHMGEFFVNGPGALEFLNYALTNDAGKLTPGKAQYTLMCNKRGGVVDDLYLYCLGLGNYLLIVNASRIDVDFAHLEALLAESAQSATVFLENKSSSYGAVAVQGPKVVHFIEAALPSGHFETPSFVSLEKNEVRMMGFRSELIYVARTGYTGEDGFEVVAPAPLIEKVWTACMEAGGTHQIKPCGLGARDTLRTEACYPLYGHELDENTSPIEAGLSYFVNFEKGDFLGRQTLLEQKTSGPARKLVAFKMLGKSAPPRPDYAIWSSGEDSRSIGRVTSGTQSPTLGAGIGLGYLPSAFSKPDTAIQIEIRGNRFPAVTIKKPFYKKAH
jgi:aminomethyltransferase